MEEENVKDYRVLAQLKAIVDKYFVDVQNARKKAGDAVSVLKFEIERIFKGEEL